MYSKSGPDIRFTWVNNAVWMIMGNDEAIRLVAHRRIKDLAWMHENSGERSHRDPFVVDDAPLNIAQDDKKAGVAPADVAPLAAARLFAKKLWYAVSATFVLTASYVMHGRRPALARRLPWRELESLARGLDSALLDRVVPAGARHTIVGRLTV